MNSNFEKLAYLYKALSDKKGQNIVALDLGEAAMLADIFVIVTGNSETHMRTLVDVAEEALFKNGIKTKIEGLDSPNWRLVDGGNVLVHVFSHKGRELYNVEKLWGDSLFFTPEFQDV